MATTEQEKHPPVMSPRGRLRVSRRVRYQDEFCAHRLAGAPLPEECALIAAWRTALERATATGYHVEYAQQKRLEGAGYARLLPYLELALAVKRLRAETRKRPLAAGSIVGQPGVPAVTSGWRRHRSQLDVNVAFGAIAAGEEFSDGLSFGAIGVRLCDKQGQLAGLVTWDGSHGASSLHAFVAGNCSIEADPVLKLLARRALRREGSRLLREAVRLITQRGQPPIAQSDETQA